MDYFIKKLNQPFVRYLFVGVSTTLIDIGIFWILINVFHLYYLLAQIINSPIVLIYNYLGHKKITFNHNDNKLVRYVILAIINYFVGLGLLYVYVDIVHLQPILGKIFTIATFMFYNFFALRLFVFKK